MGVPPLRGPFQTPKISAEGPLQESCNMGLRLDLLLEQVKQVNATRKAGTIRTKRAEKKTATHVQALVVKMPFWS